MCYPPWGYIVFSLKKLKFYEGRWLKAGNRGPDIRAGGWGRINQTPVIPILLSCHVQVS